MQIASKKLLLLSVVFVALFIGLGSWQLSRAKQKKALLQVYAERLNHAPLTMLRSSQDLRFYQAKLSGTFDNAHTILLDNKIFQHRIGYEVYTPFKLKDTPTIILVDRGFVPLTAHRQDLPSIPAILGEVTIMGLLNKPPKYIEWGRLSANNTIRWPFLVEFMNLQALEKNLMYPLFPYVLILNKNQPFAFALEWQIVVMPPEKHIAYAIQWFALAVTLLILCVVLSFRKRHSE